MERELTMAVIAGAATITCVITLLVLIFKIGDWKGSTSTSLNNIIETANEDRRTFNGFASEIRQDIKKIFLRLPLHPPPLEGKSPLQLSDWGRVIADYVEAEDWAREVAPDLRAEVKDLEDYQIDKFARHFAEGELSFKTNWGERVDRCAYALGVGREDVVAVMGVVLRNHLLEKPPSPFRETPG